MISNCNKLYWIVNNVGCSYIISYVKILLADFAKWNPTLRSDCSSMQAMVNVCVGAIGATPTTKPPYNNISWQRDTNFSTYTTWDGDQLQEIPICGRRRHLRLDH